MDYLSAVLKEQSVSALYAAFQNSALTNQFDKMALGPGHIELRRAKCAGQSDVLPKTVNNPDLDSRMKAMVIIQQAGAGFGQFANEVPQRSASGPEPHHPFADNACATWRR